MRPDQSPAEGELAVIAVVALVAIIVWFIITLRAVRRGE